jgi:pimeloyl-ACP methyl ester carboxylesterase
VHGTEGTIRSASVRVGDRVWRYHVGTTGLYPLLLLGGSLGSSAGTAKLLSERLPTVRLIVPEYAPASSMQECLQGLQSILEQEGIERVALLGGSFGGIIAQAWAHRFPQRTTHLILSGTAPPDPSRLPNHSRTMQILPLIPLPVIKLFLRIMLRILLRDSKEPQWRKEYLGLIGSLTKEDLKSRYQLAMDFDRDCKVTSLPASVEMLILEGDRDRIADALVREKLRKTYPQARSHIFQGGGHSPMITHTSEWTRVVAGFLQSLA